MSQAVKRPTKLLVTGGVQRKDAVWAAAHQRYNQAIVGLVDLETSAVEIVLEYQTPPNLCSEDRPAIVFKSAHLEGETLYLCTETEVLIVGTKDFETQRHFSLPCFNDVHHARPIGDRLFVVSTGLDMVVALDPESGEPLEYFSTCDEEPWARFDRSVDYRRIGSTKPHRSHPNFVFELEGDAWVTRCQDRDAVRLADRSDRMAVEVGLVHDGLVRGSEVWFTTVNGHVCSIASASRKLSQDIDLAAAWDVEGVLGWCRGLHLESGSAWVGFSRLRPTRLSQNLRWVKNLGRPQEILPTRIAEIELPSGRRLNEIVLEEAGFSAVFSILPIYGPGS